MSPTIWSSAIAHQHPPSPPLLILLLTTLIISHLPPTTTGQLLYSPPSSTGHHYKPLISGPVHTIDNNKTSDNDHPQPQPQSSTRLYQGWTPVRMSATAAAAASVSASHSPNSVYTAINPVSSSSSSSSLLGSGTNKYATVAVSVAETVPPSNSTNGYLSSESISRNSYQKLPSSQQQSTYMIQPAKYRAAFSSTRTTNSSSSSSNSTSKSTTGIKRKSKYSSKIIQSEVMPIPLIKPHRHGATLGFNLPDQGLTLYLDINELATKPMAQNIGLKVVSHTKDDELIDGEEEELNEVKPKAGKGLRKRLTKVIKKTRDGKNVTIVTASKSATRDSSKSSRLQSNTPTTTLPPPPGSTKKIKYSTKTKSGETKGVNNILSPANKVKQQQQQQVIEIPSLNHELNINSEKIFESQTNNLTRNDIPPTASRIPSTYVSQQQRKEGESEQLNQSPPSLVSSILGDEDEDSNGILLPDLIKEAGPGAEAPSDEPIVKIPTTTTTSTTPASSTSSETEEESEESGEAENEAGDGDSENVERSVNEAEADAELEEAIEEENAESDNLPTTTSNSLNLDEDDEGFQTTTQPPSQLSFNSYNTQPGEEAALRSGVITTTTSPPTTQTPPKSSENEVDEGSKLSQTQTSSHPLNASSQARQQEAVDNKFVAQMQSLLEKSAQLVDISAQTCSAAVSSCKANNPCEPNFSQLSTVDSPTQSLRELATQLGANQVLTEVGGSFEAELQDAMDFNTGGYTIFLPSNEAISRLPPSLLRRWKAPKGQGETSSTSSGLSAEVYLLEGAHSLESLAARKIINTRGRSVKLHVGHPHNRTYTVNGQRVVAANQKAPGGGLVHIIDGLLYPHSDKDIVDTLKACGRLDGFVTLAEGTGFAATLRKEGPFTVFVPSNDALQKVPDTDLEVIRRNMTALREFLKYHVAEGVYYSQDLMDGQFLPSLLEGEYLQAGVRVDGCTRRLVEVNVSPLYRADIPASNGVIHVVDWILKPDDRDWCNGVILPRRR